MSAPERFAVLGDPVAHSLSPAMHAAAIRAAGLPAVYEAHRVPAHKLDAHVACLREGYRGFNVTIPHKRQILRTLDQVAAAAREMGAVNTVVVQDGTLTGFNTDPVGFERALRGAGYVPGYGRTVVFGAGGAARAVIYTLIQTGEMVSIVNRNEERGAELAAHFGQGVTAVSHGEEHVREVVEAADLIVNATPLGMESLSDRSPLPATARLSPRTVVFDLVYGRETPLLRQAREQGCRAIDGLEMLVQQGAESFRLWTGTVPDVEVMREACREALKERACSVS